MAGDRDKQAPGHPTKAVRRVCDLQSQQMAETKNYFIHATAAERYVRGRPDLHPPIVQRICEVTGRPRFVSALDVGCGTGLSTRAIARVADRVIGIDTSREMLGQATGGSGIAYQQARAESLPFADGSFDLVNAGLAFHWFAPDAFLREARRVLTDAGWLVIYNSGFLGQLHGEDDFAQWHRSVYLARYPTPPRSPSDVTDAFVRPFGLTLVQKETHDQDIAMSSEQFVGYLLTQSNVIAVVEQGSERLEDVAQFLVQGVAPFFDGQTRMLKWQSHIDFVWACG
jgi:SAM-dependent methyltransferase